MDGIRAYWNGKKLLSKQGYEIRTPKFFVQDLPNIDLDGELWLGRDSYETLRAILRLNKETNWTRVKYVLFDLPASKHWI